MERATSTTNPIINFCRRCVFCNVHYRDPTTERLIGEFCIVNRQVIHDITICKESYMTKKYDAELERMKINNGTNQM